MTTLTGANAIRTAHAASYKVPAARRAIEIIERTPPRCGSAESELQRQYLEVLNARVQYPEDCLADLAKSLGMTKHTYSARLRRALGYARRIS